MLHDRRAKYNNDDSDEECQLNATQRAKKRNKKGGALLGAARRFDATTAQQVPSMNIGEMTSICKVCKGRWFPKELKVGYFAVYISKFSYLRSAVIMATIWLKFFLKCLRRFAKSFEITRVIG